MALAAGRKDDETGGGQDGGGGGVQEALEGVDAEGVGERNFVFAGKQERADGFASTTEQEHSGEAGKGHGVDGPEGRRTNVFLEAAPAEGANEIANVN